MSTLSAPSKRPLTPGDLLVDPRHGVVVVEGFESRPHAGKLIGYVRLRAVNGLMILLPEDSVDRVGLRAPMRPEQVEQMLGVLSSAPRGIPPWRQKEFMLLRRRVESGDPLEVAAVLRDLVGKEQGDKGLGASEKALLGKATEILATELALILHTSEGAATQRIAEALEGES